MQCCRSLSHTGNSFPGLHPHVLSVTTKEYVSICVICTSMLGNNPFRLCYAALLCGHSVFDEIIATSQDLTSLVRKILLSGLYLLGGGNSIFVFFF